ncbi:hypothetical protein [Microtetraspora malaysiensis]|uniref:hypothetical protein n=1 Tax=Microtetraspora malaysiensis TaxID=161358 RepID=UPI003D91A884
MIDTIDAEDAWWPPTFKPEGFSRTRFAWWMTAEESQSTRFSTSRSTANSVVVRGPVTGLVIMRTPFTDISDAQNSSTTVAQLKNVASA